MTFQRKKLYGKTKVLWLLGAGLATTGITTSASDFPVARAVQAVTNPAEMSWIDALRDTAQTGRQSLVLVTSSRYAESEKLFDGLKDLIQSRYGSAIHFVQLKAEDHLDRLKSMNVRMVPTALLYSSDGRGGLQLSGFREGTLDAPTVFQLLEAIAHPVSTANASMNHQDSNSYRKSVRIQRVSATTPAPAEPPPAQLSSESEAQQTRDGQVAAVTHQHHYAQASAQGSPQTYMAEPPAKQMPPSPFKSTPPQQSITSPPQQSIQAPPQQPVQSPPAGFTAQPVYGYVPQQQPVYMSPPSSPPLMVQPPAGQVVVQPAPLNVMVAPSPPPQVSYMMPAMPSQPMMAPAPAMAVAPPVNAFSAPPTAPAPAAFAAPPPTPAPAAFAAPPVATQPAFAAGPPPGAQSGFGSMAMGLMLTNPNLLDRFLGGIGRILAERSQPRVRMNPESPSLFAAPAGMGGFVGINPAMAMAPSATSPVQAYMAVPNGGGGGDATEDYIKAYIALCKEKGITPTLPGLEQPPTVQPPVGPVPSPQDVQHRKKGWFH